MPGPIQIGVPNSAIDQFTIPTFLLAIYQAAGVEYGIPWQVLAAINEIETGFGRNLSVSSAGAMGWMQFIPSSWRLYGVDANGDGLRDPYNPADAIFAAARYLRAAGAGHDLRRAIFAYNHADWYVNAVMARSEQIGALPDDLVGALIGLTQGRLPVRGRASYAEAANAAGATAPVQPFVARTGIDIHTEQGSPAVAVNDGVITRVGRTRELGGFVELRDVYGNLYTYSQLGRVAPTYPAPKATRAAAINEGLESPPPDPRPGQPASAGRQQASPSKSSGAARRPRVSPVRSQGDQPAVALRSPIPSRGRGAQPARWGRPVAGYASFEAYSRDVLDLGVGDVVLHQLKPGAQVIAGTVLGRIDRAGSGSDPRLHFTVRPPGEGSPAIDPKPILDGWRLLESAAVKATAGKNALFGADGPAPTSGQLLLLGKESLGRRVLADPRIEIYGCGRRDVQAGQVDRRVLATLAFLSSAGLEPTVTSLRCGHSYFTKGGSVSEHSSGNAVDIAAINGTSIAGHQGPGSITETAIRRLLTLQGSLRPHQIISLMKFEGADNTLSMSDHADHIHVGFRSLSDPGGALGRQYAAVLKPDQWPRLTRRINQIYQPAAPANPSRPTRSERRSKATGPREPKPVARDRGAVRAPVAAVGDGPSIKVKPSVLERGDRLVVKGADWICKDGLSPALVTITLGESGAELGDAEPDAEGEFKVRIKLARDLLPEPGKDPDSYVIFASAECLSGPVLFTAKPPSILVRHAASQGGEGSGRGAGGGNGDRGGQRERASDGSDAESQRRPKGSSDNDASSPKPNAGAGSGEQQVAGVSDESSGKDGKSDKDHRNRDGKGGDGNDASDGGTKDAKKNKDKNKNAAGTLDAAVPASGAKAAPTQSSSAASLTFPGGSPPPWYLIAAICSLLAAALAGASVLAGRWLTPPADPDAVTQRLTTGTPPSPSPADRA